MSRLFSLAPLMSSLFQPKQVIPWLLVGACRAIWWLLGPLVRMLRRSTGLSEAGVVWLAYAAVMALVAASLLRR